MKMFTAAFLISVSVLLSLSCTAIDPEKAAYGGSQRVGICAVTYVPVIAVTAENELAYLATGDLGFSPSSTVELSYALPLAKGFDVRAVIGSGKWKVNFHENWISSDEEATWEFTSLMFLLTGGWRWERFGLHFGSGLGVLFNELDWKGHDTSAHSSLALQSHIGTTVTLHPMVEAELEVGFRWSRAGYSYEDIDYDQILECALVRLGVEVLF